MVRCTVNLGEAGRLLPAPFVGSDGRAVAWLEIDGAADVALFGTASDLRGLAAAASLTADRADALLAVSQQPAAAEANGGG
jgi:hypothetical protein